IAAMIVEPLVQGAAGMLMYPAEELKRFRELCTAHDVLLIADEVFTGFGRTGRMFSCEHAGITPDLMCLSKGLTGGFLPLAVTVIRFLYRAWCPAAAARERDLHGSAVRHSARRPALHLRCDWESVVAWTTRLRCR